MNIVEQRKVFMGEAKRAEQDINRNLLLLRDKDSTAKQRRALNQATAIIGKAMKHVKQVMAM